MNDRWWTFLLMALLLTAGCTGDATDQTGDTAENTDGVTEQAGDSAPGTGAETDETSNSETPAPTNPAAPVASGVPTGDTAEAAVQTVMNGMSTGNTTVLWASLPAGYQQDINDVVQAFGNGMDPTQWQQIHGTVEKVHAVLSTKADFIVNVPAIQAMGQGEQLKEAIPQIAGLLKTLLDHTDLESLKSFDGEQFFSGPASNLVVQIDALSQLSPVGFTLASLKDVTVETISSEGDQATLRITSPMDNDEAEEVEFVQVDGHWVPADMASGWEENIAEAKADLDKLPETTQESAMMVAMMTNAITGALQPLEAAEDQEQFNTAVDQLQAAMGQMMGPLMFGGFPGGDADTEMPPGFDPSEFEEVSPEPAVPPAEESPVEEEVEFEESIE